VVELAGLVLARNVSVASAHVEAMRRRGVAVESLYLDLLAPAARHLGELWTADVCDFTQVTIGLGRLQNLLHELSPTFQADGSQRSNGLRVLLVPAPGDQHTFGLSMVAEFFRRAGWDVWGQTPMSRRDLLDAVRSEWFALVGLSVSCGTRLEALSSCVRAVRRVSRNRRLGILVGGPAFTEEPALASLVGADATAADGRGAAAQAQNLLSLLVRRN
jgi:methanogenic corrinoid protein MtbC1